MRRSRRISFLVVLTIAPGLTAYQYLPNPRAAFAFTIIVSSIALVFAWIIVVREGRQKGRLLAGRCLSCGYDLRATPNRCPECGQPNVRRQRINR